MPFDCRWPQSLGFPLTVSLITIISLAVPIPLYYIPSALFLTTHSTSWIVWTFITMAMPVGVAFGILMSHERHLSLRHSLSETQRIFTSSWWTGESGDTFPSRERDRRRPAVLSATSFGSDGSSLDPTIDGVMGGARPRERMRKRWIPASFVRFMWFGLALSISFLAYVLGEAYAEIYLMTLPHSNLETIVYVYSWVVTVHLLDGLTGWILGGGEGERVGSYPLGWIFKLFVSSSFSQHPLYIILFLSTC